MFVWLYPQGSFAPMLHRLRRFSATEYDPEEGPRFSVLAACENDAISNEDVTSEIHCVEPDMSQYGTKCDLCFPAKSE